MRNRRSHASQPDGERRFDRRTGLLGAASALASIAGLGVLGVAADDAATACPVDPTVTGSLVERWFLDVLNQRRLELLETLVAPNVEFDSALEDRSTGVENVRTDLNALFAAFPDVAFTIDDTLIDGEHAVVRWTAAGTHEGDFAGIDASNVTRHWNGIHFFTVTCGRIEQIWTEEDTLAQLGLTNEVEATPIPAISQNGSPAATCEPPTRSEMEMFANAWQDVWTSHDITAYEGVVSPDAVHHFGNRADAVGLPAIQHTLEGFFAAFPDLSGPIEAIVVDGDRVAFRYTDIGTNSGSFFGADPTGREVRWTGMTILRVDCGQIVESWAEVAGYRLWQQLGLLDSVATPEA